MTKRFRVIGILASIGVALALYLFYEYLAPVHQSICYVNSNINCEASTKGILATTFGIPTALYGLTGYILILVSSVTKWRRMVIGVAAFGLLFCLRITYFEVFVIKVICPVCLLCQLDMIAIFMLSVLKLPHK